MALLTASPRQVGAPRECQIRALGERHKPGFQRPVCAKYMRFTHSGRRT